MTGYLAAARHPFTHLAFVLPLLVGYEAAVAATAADPAPIPRNGADAWVRYGLANAGLNHPFAAPVLLAGVLAVRAWAATDPRPRPLGPVLFGMAAESLAAAAGLWLVARHLADRLGDLGPPLAVPPAGRLVQYVGAGVYEEAVFRLGLFSALAVVARCGGAPGFVAAALAAVGSAAAFAAAHHVGSAGDPFHPTLFAVRSAAGLYFAVVFVTRGFGVAVGAHVGYDVLVGVEVG